MQTKTQTLHNNVPVEEIISETAPHSVELSRNAKGQFSWTIKMYFKEEDKGAIVGEVEKLNNIMLLTFPNVDDTEKLTKLDKKVQGK
jgi:hypothetical protein